MSRPDDLRIRVAKNDDDYPWPFTAHLEWWDGDEWRYEAAEDGDTAEEAVAELRSLRRRARDLPSPGIIS